jgi:hypothetical protein
MVEKEIFTTKYTPSTLKKGVKKPQKCEKRQKFPYNLLVMVLGELSLCPLHIQGLKVSTLCPIEGAHMCAAKVCN